MAQRRAFHRLSLRPWDLGSALAGSAGHRQPAAADQPGNSPRARHLFPTGTSLLYPVLSRRSAGLENPAGWSAALASRAVRTALRVGVPFKAVAGPVSRSLWRSHDPEDDAATLEFRAAHDPRSCGSRHGVDDRRGPGRAARDIQLGTFRQATFQLYEVLDVDGRFH